MTYKILWLYPKEMNLYGDRGNLTILQKRLEWRGLSAQIDALNVGEPCNPSDYNLIYMGGGPDAEQRFIYEDCLNRTAQFKEAYAQGTFFLLICGGYQLFGDYYDDQDMNRIKGVHLFDYHTESGAKKRCIGNLVVDTVLDDQPVTLVGFENHGGQTIGVTTPIGQVRYGHGNSFNSGFEGFMDRQAIGTYMHGSLLSKNPELADYVIRHSLKEPLELSPLDDHLEAQAKTILIQRFMKKQNS